MINNEFKITLNPSSNNKIRQFYWAIPFIIQAILFGMDEFCYHRNRFIPLLEKWGHVLDTLVFLICIYYALYKDYRKRREWKYIFWFVLSCLVVLKEESIHYMLPISLGEQWLHSILFVLHPILLGSLGYFWVTSQKFIWLKPWFYGVGFFLFYYIAQVFI